MKLIIKKKKKKEITHASDVEGSDLIWMRQSGSDDDDDDVIAPAAAAADDDDDNDLFLSPLVPGRASDIRLNSIEERKHKSL